ncbi:unnamed protein product [Protopolystoma xenopodis]|uniref:Uncharacterized protein n=1 Tax=Protopolystoma xenopodis TaxID=117903 RepID=A0A448XSA2_9PLAT|nr:unnamed protein product [Protopolystoma xenopodis]
MLLGNTPKPIISLTAWQDAFRAAILPAPLPFRLTDHCSVRQRLHLLEWQQSAGLTRSVQAVENALLVYPETNDLSNSALNTDIATLSSAEMLPKCHPVLFIDPDSQCLGWLNYVEGRRGLVTMHLANDDNENSFQPIIKSVKKNSADFVSDRVSIHSCLSGKTDICSNATVEQKEQLNKNIEKQITSIRTTLVTKESSHQSDWQSMLKSCIEVRIRGFASTFA